MKPILLIDCGNTQIKFGLFADDALAADFSIRNTIIHQPAFDLKNVLKQQGIHHQDIGGTVIASVVPDSTACLIGQLPLPMMMVDHEHCGGMKIALPNPQEVGADRLVNAYGAYARYGHGQIVIDFGTATTLDVVDQDGAYAGGVILPGIDLTRHTLHEATAKLPLIAITRPEKILGKTTQQAINQGLYWGYVSMLEGLVTRLTAEQNTRFNVIATGGYAHLFAPDCPFIHQYEPQLTLQGLGLLAGKEWNNA